MMDFLINKTASDSLIRNAILEDMGAYGDITSSYIFDEKSSSSGYIVCKEKNGAILCGIDIAETVFSLIDKNVKIKKIKKDSEKLNFMENVLEISGSTISLLNGERTALNFMQHLSGIATLTSKFALAAEKYNVKITETRKTLPGLRVLEKYAVRCGGGFNHRFGLFDGILIKDNHIIAAGSVKEAIMRARLHAPHTLKIEVEVKNSLELNEAVKSKADIIMLDNMDLEEMTDSVKFIRKNLGNSCIIEASGNVTLEKIDAICKTGIDIISTGKITNSAPSIDFSLELE